MGKDFGQESPICKSIAEHNKEVNIKNCKILDISLRDNGPSDSEANIAHKKSMGGHLLFPKSKQIPSFGLHLIILTSSA